MCRTAERASVPFCGGKLPLILTRGRFSLVKEELHPHGVHSNHSNVMQSLKYKLLMLSLAKTLFSYSGDWVIGGPRVTLCEWQPKLTCSALWARPLLQSSGTWINSAWKNMTWNNLDSAQIMSIENCPLSQIPTEIVSGGPSLVIQVNFSSYVSIPNKLLPVYISMESYTLWSKTKSCPKNYPLWGSIAYIQKHTTGQKNQLMRNRTITKAKNTNTNTYKERKNTQWHKYEDSISHPHHYQHHICWWSHISSTVKLSASYLLIKSYFFNS